MHCLTTINVFENVLKCIKPTDSGNDCQKGIGEMLWDDFTILEPCVPKYFQKEQLSLLKSIALND